MGANRVKRLFYEKLEAEEGSEHPWVQKRLKEANTEIDRLRGLLHRSLGYVQHYSSCTWPQSACVCGFAAWSVEVEDLGVCDCGSEPDITDSLQAEYCSACTKARSREE